MKNKKIVSVVMPIHNAETTLRASLVSVLSQQRYFDELVVVDDASSDTSMKIVKEARSKIGKSIRIKVVSNLKSEGLASAYNKGISACSGDLVITMHADVVLKVGAVRELTQPVLDDEGIVATYHIVNHPYTIWNGYNFWQKCFFSRLVGKKYVGLDGKFDCFRKKDLLGVGLFDGVNYFRAGEDGDIFRKLKKRGRVIPTKAEIVHLHDMSPSFGPLDIIKKHAAYADAQGALFRRYGFEGPVPFITAFFREILLVSLFVPLVNIVAVPLCIAYSFMYTKEVFLSQCRNPRILLLPLFNVLLLAVSLYGSTKGFLDAKQTI